MKQETYRHKLGAAELTIEVNDWMKYTESSIIASMGNTKVMIALALGGESDKDYLPLKVEYQERFYARGEILGGKYNKREGRPSTEAILTARVVDRAIRPYFPKGFNQEILVVITVLSLGEYDPDIVALNGAAAALEISSIPWSGGVAAARVVGTESGVIISPTFKEQENTTYDAVVAVKDGRVVMLEVEAAEVSEETLEQGIQTAVAEVDRLSTFIKDTSSKYLQEKISVSSSEMDYQDMFTAHIAPMIQKDMTGIQDKPTYKTWVKQFIELVAEQDPEVKTGQVYGLFDAYLKQLVRDEITKGNRMDGRDANQVRELSAQIGVLSKPVHGSGLFYRGDTHVLSIATVGKLDDALNIDGMEIQTSKNFIHHYNFPPYSVGEVGRIGSPKRREIGHGQLAEKAFRQVLPSQDDFPYTMRIVSEVLSSNGSTSMGSVCGTSLALHHAGVPLPSHVAGIAMGLVYESDDNYTLLTDILGKEDHYGDMDFKVAGTKKGITAVQLDCKFGGLNEQLITETLAGAKTAREQILNTLDGEIAKPNPLTDAVEQVEKMSIPQDKVGLVIGRGGAMIKEITKDSGAKIDIKRDGTAFIFGNSENINKAKEIIQKVLSR